MYSSSLDSFSNDIYIKEQSPGILIEGVIWSAGSVYCPNEYGTFIEDIDIYS